MARKRPGRYDAGVNGLHGRLVRAPVDDGGRPGRLGRRVTTTKERNLEIAAQRSGPNFRADEVSGRASRFSEKRHLACLREIVFERLDHLPGEHRLISRRPALHVTDAFKFRDEFIDAGSDGFVARGVGEAVPDGRR